ncbi:SDR family NAD(P)-dependent oxidoreductase [Nocardioides panacisoli]|uniref:SDR family oxidoreductase n=1 Tax=Nocardioides panacisoli TaxID=627624 RepID=A0ABP7J2P3_9ACTN
MTTKIALVTGGSAGLGRALVHALAARGWQVITDARHAGRLAASVADLPEDAVTALAGDITDAEHRADLAAAVARHGRLDLLVHNASLLGPTSGEAPYRVLTDTTPEDLQQVWRHNVGAPLVLTSLLLRPLLDARGVLLSISSDAAVEHHAGWGLYSASKAALDHVTLQIGAEHPEITAYAVDPGDMRTDMHQQWFAGEDISDRPLPETVVPRLLALLDERPRAGRYRAADIAVPTGAVA